MNPKYVSPRLAIARLSSLEQLQAVRREAERRHKHYFHFFNLTNVKLPAERETSFKWRGLPFSLSELLRLLAMLDAFLRNNIANAAILCVANPQAELYARLILRSYIELCLASAPEGPTGSTLRKAAEGIVNSHTYFLREVQQVYKTISVHSPPVKLLESFSIKPEGFIPVLEVSSEGRYNDFEPVYTHAVEEELAVYYLNLNRPLETGIGRKYYDGRPETKYFSRPVAVAGDVKIAVYSYRTLKRVYEFTVGFNTLAMDALARRKGVVELEGSDLHDGGQGVCVEIEYSDYCEGKQCAARANCPDCREFLKKMATRYADTQLELEKLHRPRTLPEVATLLSL